MLPNCGNCAENESGAARKPTLVPTRSIGLNGLKLTILGPFGEWRLEPSSPRSVSERLSPGVHFCLIKDSGGRSEVSEH